MPSKIIPWRSIAGRDLGLSKYSILQERWVRVEVFLRLGIPDFLTAHDSLNSEIRCWGGHEPAARRSLKRPVS
jgi:hypothetical protein